MINLFSIAKKVWFPSLVGAILLVYLFWDPQVAIGVTVASIIGLLLSYLPSIKRAGPLKALNAYPLLDEDQIGEIMGWDPPKTRLELHRYAEQRPGGGVLFYEKGVYWFANCDAVEAAVAEWGKRRSVKGLLEVLRAYGFSTRGQAEALAEKLKALKAIE
jgi:hypothetical protein